MTKSSTIEYTTTSSCLWIQALKRYQSSVTTCESSITAGYEPNILWYVLATAVNLSSHNSMTREYNLLLFFHHFRLTAEVWSERQHSLLKSALFNEFLPNTRHWWREPSAITTDYSFYVLLSVPTSSCQQGLNNINYYYYKLPSTWEFLLSSNKRTMT